MQVLLSMISSGVRVQQCTQFTKKKKTVFQLEATKLHHTDPLTYMHQMLRISDAKLGILQPSSYQLGFRNKVYHNPLATN
jgi:hypothetical protein